jgi:hypothetical protein
MPIPSVVAVRTGDVLMVTVVCGKLPPPQLLRLILPLTTPPGGGTPVPLSVTVAVDGMLPALSLMVNEPGCDPIPVGVRVIAMAQVAPAASVPGLAHVVDGSRAYPVPDSTRGEMFSATVWLFLKRVVRMALLLPTATLPKFKEVIDNTVGATPVPLSVTVAVDGVLPASLMVNEPGCGPVTAGVRVIAMAQVAPAASVPGLAHVVVDRSRAYPVPVSASDEMFSAVVWLFLKRVVRMALLLPTATLPKFKEVIDNTVGATPVPLSVTVAVDGVLPALSLMVNEPGCAPVAAGVRVIAMAQVAPAASVPGLAHVVVDRSRAYPVPVSASDEMFSAVVWLFLNATFPMALLLPTATLPKFNAVVETVVCA